MKNVKSTLSVGCAALMIAPLAVFLMVVVGAFIWGWTWQLCYNLLIYPQLVKIGYRPMDIPYLAFVIAYISVGIFKGPFRPISKNKDEAIRDVVSGIGTRHINGLILAGIIWILHLILF